MQRSNLALALVGSGLVVVAMLYSWLGGWVGSPRWEDSLGGFLWRFGTVLAAVPLAYTWRTYWRGPEWLRELGVASLFVYWIHVELAYGVVSTPLHKSFSFEVAVLAGVVFTFLLLGLVRLKSRLATRVEFPVVVKYLRKEHVTGS